MPIVSADVPVDGPYLSVASTRAQYRECGSSPLLDLGAGEVRAIDAGNHVVVDECGRAVLHWPDAAIGGVGKANLITGDLLTGTDLQVDSASPDARCVLLSQSAGTARYTVAETGELSELTVQAGEVTVSTHQGADFIVSFQPGEPAGADVDRADQAEAAGDAGGEDAAEAEDAEAGKAEAAGATGTLWVMMISGEAELTGRSSVVVAGRALPAETSILEQGQVAAFTASGQFAGALAIDTAAMEAWYSAIAACADYGPIAILPSAPQVAPSGTGTPSATQVAMLSGEPQISFTADRMSFDYGECTVLHWSLTNATLFTLDGVPVPASGSREVCPPETTFYTLSWVRRDGIKDQVSLAITVDRVGQVAHVKDEDRPRPPPTETECVGPECELPGDDPWPTDTPWPTPTPKPPATEPPPTEVPATEPPTLEPPTPTPVVPVTATPTMEPVQTVSPSPTAPPVTATAPLVTATATPTSSDITPTPTVTPTATPSPTVTTTPTASPTAPAAPTPSATLTPGATSTPELKGFRE